LQRKKKALATWEKKNIENSTQLQSVIHNHTYLGRNFDNFKAALAVDAAEDIPFLLIS